MTNMFNDLRYALRQLRKSPCFALTAILTLALGIGAATAIFSLVDAVLFRPLPFPQQGRLVWLNEAMQLHGTDARRRSAGAIPLSYPDFFDWRAGNHSFSAMASYRTNSFTLTRHGDAMSLNGTTVSADFFRVVGVNPAVGRGFLRSEEKRGAYTVVLSHRLWQSTFGAARDIVGKNIVLGGKSYRVVGVMPKGFAFPIETPSSVLWTTLADDSSDPDSPLTAQRGANMLSVIARLKPGMTLAKARADTDLIARNLSVQYPASNKQQTAANVEPLIEHLVGNSQVALRVLFAAVMLVLLIACANVAGLLLARAAQRRPEIALRAALGASRATILRQVLVESVFLSLCGGALGLGLSVGMLDGMLRFVPHDLPRMGQVSVNGAVLGFTLLVSLLTGLLFGAMPAWRMSRLDPALALRDGTRTATGGRLQYRLHSWLVISETAVGLVLLIAAGLLIRSFVHVLRVNPGFDPRHVLTASMDLPENRYSTQQQIQFYNQLLPRVAALPGVQLVAAGWPLPLSGHGIAVDIDVQGKTLPPGEEPIEAVGIVTPEYFAALRIPLLQGRDFRVNDNANATPVAIVSQSFARKYFPGGDPIGKRIEPGLSDGLTKKSMREIVGVVGDVKRKGLTAESDPQCYLPYPQAAVTSPTLVIRTAGIPTAIIGSLRAQLATMDKNVPLYDVRTFEDITSRSAAQPRFQMLLLTSFAGMALLLSAIGLYGVLAYMVAQRRLEIGLRMAMGAQRSDVVGMVLGRGLSLSLAGLGIGLGLSLLLTRFMVGMLYGVHPFDLVTFATVTVAMMALSLAASFVPARRAASIDPGHALRSE